MIKALSIVAIFVLLIVGYYFMRPTWVPVYQKIVGKQTVLDVIEEYGHSAEVRLLPYFENAGAQYPPTKVTLIAIKDTEQLELWAGSGESYKFVRSYSILAASGILGPKLREGDRQVPEGLYNLEYLNPNSSYHLSMKLNYPNKFDLKHARIEGRTEPGTNIFIHGKALSIGCLAMGDAVIEELFYLTSTIGKENVEVIIAPSDSRKKDIMVLAENQPDWVEELYEDITQRLRMFQHDT